jgi:hypothetical protein
VIASTSLHRLELRVAGQAFSRGQIPVLVEIEDLGLDLTRNSGERSRMIPGA